MIRSPYAALGRLIAACSVVATFSLPAFANDKIRVGESSSVCFCFLPVVVADKAGIWAKHQLDVELFALSGDAQLQQAIVAKNVEIGLGSGPALGFISRGVPAKGVAATTNSLADMALNVSDQSGIKSLDDLKDKRMGISSSGSLTDWLSRKIAQLQGWAPDAVTRVPLGGFSTNVAALKAGSIQSFIMGPETGYLLQDQHEGHVLTTFDKLVPHFVAHIIMARNDVIAEHPDQVKRFLAGWFEAVDYMKSHRKETIDIAAEQLKLSTDIMGRTYDQIMPTVSSDGAFDAQGLDELAESLVQLGILSTKPDMTKLVDERFQPGK